MTGHPAPAGWQHVRQLDGTTAVYPNLDSQPHDIWSRDCACGVTVIPVARIIGGKSVLRKLYTHEAWDGRE